MSPSRFLVRAAILALAVMGPAAAADAQVSPPDSLVLQTPSDVKVRSVYDRYLKRFVVWLNWREAPDAVSALIHPPDLTNWAVTTPPAQLSQPRMGGAYTGDTDRTVTFRAVRDGTVGVDSVRIDYSIRREEYLAGSVQLTPSYVPGTFVPVTFRDQRNNRTYDFGLQVAFGSGRIDAQGNFLVGVEDFEGFHIWRGTRPDGSDLVVIGELSKEEAFKGRVTGGSLADSVYFYEILPVLRQTGRWISPYGAIDCLGTRIDMSLDANQLFWFDCNAANGFTYYYAVTAFDRGYSVGSSSQGLVKFDNCTTTQGVPYECQDELVSLQMQVDPQNDLYNVYAVPNPFRSGSSRLTTDNYHNYPDRFIRFVNVPADCMIKVFTVSGDLVWETTHSAPTGNVEWDVTNRDGQDVTSGVYIYRLEKPNGAYVYGRIAVIR